MANNSKQMVMVPPKKPFNPKVMYTFDLIFLVAFTVVLVFLIPFDINADFVGATENSPEDITEFLESVNIDEGFFEAVFENGNLQSGGYVQAGKQNKYYLYEGTDDGGKYYSFKFAGEENYKKTKSTKVDGTGVITPRGLVTLDDSGRIYFDEINSELRGSVDFDWKQYISFDGEYDYKFITQMLVKNNDAKTPLKDAAVLSALVCENTLVGYYNDTAWFIDKSNPEKPELIKSTVDSVDILGTISPYEKYAMVAQGKYLICDSGSGISVTEIESGEGNYINLKNADGVSEDVICYTYDITEGRVRLHIVSETLYMRAKLTGKGGEYDDTQWTFYRETVENPALAIAFVDRILWIYSGDDDYKWYRLR